MHPCLLLALFVVLASPTGSSRLPQPPQQPEPPAPAIKEHTDSGDSPKAKDQNPTTPQAPTYPTPSPWFTCPGEFGLYPDVYDCSSYFECTHGFPYVEHCPPGLLFNRNLSVCDYPKAIDPPCVPLPYPSTIPPPRARADSKPAGDSVDTTKAPITPSPWFTCPEPYGIFVDVYDCASFFSCSDGRPYLEPCPPGLEFNKNVSACDYPSNIDPPCHAIPYPTTIAPALPTDVSQHAQEDSQQDTGPARLQPKKTPEEEAKAKRS